MSFQEMFKPGDLVLFVVIALVTYLWSTKTGQNGNQPEAVRIVTDRSEDTLDLFKDTVLNRGHVTVEIQNGMAAITRSNCPSELCVRTGWLDKPGQISACMPNETFIQIIGSSHETDAISY